MCRLFAHEFTPSFRALTLPNAEGLASFFKVQDKYTCALTNQNHIKALFVVNKNSDIAYRNAMQLQEVSIVIKEN